LTLAQANQWLTDNEAGTLQSRNFRPEEIIAGGGNIQVGDVLGTGNNLANNKVALLGLNPNNDLEVL